MNLVTGHPTKAPPLGFQPGLSVDDPLAAYWLRQATLRLRREVAWLWHERGTLTKETSAGTLPPIVDGLSETLDLMRYETERQAFYSEDTTAAWLTQQIELPPPDVAGAQRGSFSWLVKSLQLEPVDCFALALALGGVLDSARGTVIAACLNDVAAVQPNLKLVQRMWDAPQEVLTLLDAGHPLVTHGVFDPIPVNWQSSLEITPVVARQLLFPQGAPPRQLQGVMPHLVGDDVASLDETQLEFSVARLKTRALDRVSLAPIVGSADAPLVETAGRISRELGLPLLQVVGGVTDTATLNGLLVAAWLRGAALFLPFSVVAAKDGAGMLHLARLPLIIFVGMTESDPLAHLPREVTLARVQLKPSTYQMRLAQWQRELPEVWAGVDGKKALTDCARRFRYEARTISRVATAIRALGHPPADRDLFEACRADLELGELAQTVEPRFDLEELMLPERQTTQMGNLVKAASVLTTVHHEWGTAQAWNESGLSVLFSGPPGTGKTMAAEAIARAVNMPIFRIDLSQVVNKYIGETEKNLRRLFDAADAADVILFFDEADALFGKRTEVKDAHDRYANLEVSYLLERMERFKGMAVLASNRKKDLDEAFMRRLRYVVQFPLPGPEERLRIWQAVLPRNVDVEQLDLKFLADRVPLSGGHIRSAVFNACLQSVRDGEAPELGMAAVVRAVKEEFDKLGRAVSLDQFGRYAEHVRE